MKTIDLKAHLQLDMALGEVLQKRRTNRDCQSKQLDEEVLSTLLWACAGITDEDGRRTVPSTMDLRAVTSYVLRADGAWRYNAAQNCLEQTTDKDVREVSTVRQFDYVKTAPVTIVFVPIKNALRRPARQVFMWMLAQWDRIVIWQPLPWGWLDAFVPHLSMKNFARL